MDQKWPPPPLRGGRFPTEPGFAVPIGRVLQKTHPPSDDVFSSLSGRTSHAHCQTAEIGSTSQGRKGGPNFKTVRFTPFGALGAYGNFLSILGSAGQDSCSGQRFLFPERLWIPLKTSARTAILARGAQNGPKVAATALMLQVRQRE